MGLISQSTDICGSENAFLSNFLSPKQPWWCWINTGEYMYTHSYTEYEYSYTHMHVCVHTCENCMYVCMCVCVCVWRQNLEQEELLCIEWVWYVAELLGSHQGCQVPFRTSGWKVGLLLRCCSGQRASCCDDEGSTWFFSSCGGILELRRGIQASSCVGPGSLIFHLSCQGELWIGLHSLKCKLDLI